jgi:hypothetical protein
MSARTSDRTLKLYSKVKTMVKRITIDKVDNGHIVTRVVQEGEKATLTDTKVFMNLNDLLEWVRANA